MTRFVLAILICLLSFTICHAGSSPEDFLGPAPDYVFYYKTEHGQEMTLHGRAWTRDNGLMVEETSFSPVREQLDSYCINHLTNLYVLYADGNRLTQKLFGISQNSDKTLLDLKSPFWGNPFTWMPTSSGKVSDGIKSVSKCRIVERPRQVLFGKERTVISVAGDFCPARTYASGIGMIDFIGFKLIRIEKHGKIIRDY